MLLIGDCADSSSTDQTFSTSMLPSKVPSSFQSISLSSYPTKKPSLKPPNVPSSLSANTQCKNDNENNFVIVFMTNHRSIKNNKITLFEKAMGMEESCQTQRILK